jgi:hypothetical protein
MERERSPWDLLRFLWAFNDATFVLIVSAMEKILLEGVLRHRVQSYYKRKVSFWCTSQVLYISSFGEKYFRGKMRKRDKNAGR